MGALARTKPPHSLANEFRKTTITYLRNQNLVTSSDAHGNALAILVHGTGANCEDMSLVLRLDTALREEDARSSLWFGLDALDQDTVQERSKVLDVAKDRLLPRKSARSSSLEVVSW